MAHKEEQNEGAGSVNSEITFKGIVGARLKAEFVYYEMVSNTEEFVSVWGISGVLCKVTGDVLVLNFCENQTDTICFVFMCVYCVLVGFCNDLNLAFIFSYGCSISIDIIKGVSKVFCQHLCIKL